MIVNVKEKKDCSGCGVCAVSCPVNAIRMTADNQGFIYPVVDEVKCLSCGKCGHVCPFNDLESANESCKAYAARHVSDDVCRESTSGAMFTAISDVVLDNGGVIYAPSFNNEMYLRHHRIVNKEQRNIARGSKYVQSNATAMYCDIVSDLKAGLTVEIFGTPCQIAGVKEFVPLDYQSNLFLIDVVCNGVGSPLIWEEHVKRIKKREKKEVVNYNFRPKTRGYLTRTEIAWFSDGSSREYSYAFDRFNTIYYSGLIIRPSCSNCEFCSRKRVSDITIADFSAIKKEDVDFSIDYGVSTLLINTEKGSQLFSEFSRHIFYAEKELNQIGQIRMKQCGAENPKRDSFINMCVLKGLQSGIRHQYNIATRIRARIADCLYRVRKND